MSERDRIYAENNAPAGEFVFDDRVVRVFPDMIERSVPGYGLTVQLSGLFAHRYAQPGSRVYDLGCSLGAVTHAMRIAVGERDVRFVAADSSPQMVARCRESMAEDDRLAPVEVVEADIRAVEVLDASLTVLNYTLQFVPPADRPDLLAGIARGTRVGGALLLTEKIAFADPAEQALQTDWHHDFKRARGYSDLEIARKRDALERVMRPDTEHEHVERLRQAGWSRVCRCFQAFSFAAYLAIR